ncbi:hypothetical protein [uncultured Croceitalea sp.]|uniref:hypothetical protein n=1 Tax=uncultured Croceitalea sp. TaxID=1798908 RepID=UPI0033063618
MKRIFFPIFLLTFSFLLAQNNDNLLTGDFLVVSSDGIAVGTSKSLPFGTTGTFEYDGKSLKIAFEKELYDDIELSTGLAFKPNSAPCFSLSLSKGMELGTIDAVGSSFFENESIAKVSDNGKLEAALGGSLNYCFNWFNNKGFVLKPSVNLYQRVLTIPNILGKSVIDILYGLEFEPDFAVKYSRTSEVGLDLFTEGKIIESYCMDEDKQRPNASVELKVSSGQFPDYYSKIFEEFHSAEEYDSLQDYVWESEKEILKSNLSFEDIEIFSIINYEKDYQYFFIEFRLDLFLLYLPNRLNGEVDNIINSFKNYETEHVKYANLKLKKLENGDILISFDNQLLESFLKSSLADMSGVMEALRKVTKN